MLMYPHGPLTAAAMAKLAALQQEVDAQATHAERHKKASSLFGNKQNTTFDEIKATLAKLAPCGDACYYCERDRYRDIEHIYPKRHYPERCFNWYNYVYACTICNQDKKGDIFAVFDAAGEIICFDRHTLAADAPPPVGQAVLLDIRHEDPLQFLKLELETGQFMPIGTALEQKRGRFTRDLFELNNDDLVRHRRYAYHGFCTYLTMWAQAIKSGNTSQAEIILTEITKLPYPTVLAEMRRQAPEKPALGAWFAALDELGAAK